MTTADSAEVTRILQAHVAGDAGARERLLELIYDDLRRVAERTMRGERADHTLEPSMLVHDAYLRLVDYDRIDWKGRTHFLALAATAMRRILVDHARARTARKRGGDLEQVSWSDSDLQQQGDPIALLTLDEAIERLGRVHPRAARLVDLRFFSGLSVEEAAHVLGVSKETAKGDWKRAKAWLNRELSS